MTLYHTILADPPWQERGGGTIRRGADRHYPLMSTEDICRLGYPLRQFLADDCHLHLWVTNNFLPDGLRVVQAWGFRYVTTRTWAKDRMGLGQYARGQTEHILFAVRGKTMMETGATVTTLIGGKVLRRWQHSVKPVETYREVEAMSPGPYLELFARERRAGWHAWGNEIDSDIQLLPPDPTQLALWGGGGE